MKSIYSILILWVLALWGVLQLNRIDFATEHSVCGIWGCGPPLQALIVCHLGWGVALFPLIALLPMKYSPRIIIITGWTLLAVGLLGILCVGVYEVFNWLLRMSDEYKHLYFHRWGFAVITFTDIPMFQVMMLGVGLLFRRGLRIVPLSSDASEEPQGEAD